MLYLIIVPFYYKAMSQLKINEISHTFIFENYNLCSLLLKNYVQNIKNMH